jgi:hypothetical protein
MYAQTLENIANWNNIGGQSIVGMMRENRNQNRLTIMGVSLDNNINDTLPYDQQKVLIVNGTLPTGLANPNIPSGSTTAITTDPFILSTTPVATAVTTVDGVDITPIPGGNIDEDTGEYIVTDTTYVNDQIAFPISTVILGEPLDIGQSVEPGSFAGSPYTNLIPPNLNSWYSSSTLMPSTYTVNQAIEDVIRCNCDCWDMIN